MIILIQGPKHANHPYSKCNRDTEAVREHLIKVTFIKSACFREKLGSEGVTLSGIRLRAVKTCTAQAMWAVCAQGPVLAAQIPFGMCIFCDHI